MSSVHDRAPSLHLEEIPRLLRFIAVRIVMANPGHRERKAVLVTTLRREDQIVIRPELIFASTRVARIGVEDLAGLILEENTGSGKLLAQKGPEIIVKVD